MMLTAGIEESNGVWGSERTDARSSISILARRRCPRIPYSSACLHFLVIVQLLLTLCTRVLAQFGQCQGTVESWHVDHLFRTPKCSRYQDDWEIIAAKCNKPTFAKDLVVAGPRTTLYPRISSFQVFPMRCPKQFCRYSVGGWVALQQKQ